MKRLIVALLGLSTLVGLAYYVSRPGPTPATPADTAIEPALELTNEGPQPVSPLVARPMDSSPAASEPLTAKGDVPTQNRSTDPRLADTLALQHTIEILVSPQAGYDQKQAAWKQIRDAGKFDPLIAELERKAAEDPRSAAYPAALGQAYLQKCGTLQDVREQGILAMQADKVFDTALNLDPANWEARFTKAVALSYWPANMGKGQEVLEHFRTLVLQQETQTPQPQFAETYVWLGDQCQKMGQADEARSAWERGAGVFPNHDKLKSRLAGETQAAR